LRLAEQAQERKNPMVKTGIPTFGIVVLASLIPAQAPSVHVEISEDPVLDAARNAAASFAKSLPDYIVKRTTTRYTRYRPSALLIGSPHVIDTVTADVASQHGQEVYSNTKIDGKPTNDPQITGSWSSGEFSSALLGILSIQNAAVFTNKSAATIAHRPTYRYHFAIDHAHSSWQIDDREGTRTIHYAPAYAGVIWIDRQTGQTLRIEMDTRDLPEGFSIDHISSATEYDFVRIGDASYPLPTHSETTSCFHNTPLCAWNETTFQDYKKFQASAAITFDGIAK
jgi:hypothetical protein